MSSPSLPHIGDILADKYRIDDQLGEGGMAVVFGAHHLLLDKPVAVKVLSPELPQLPQLTERFLSEARAAARVDSPYVTRVMDVGALANGLPYMVMERLDGCDLEELLRREKKLAIDVAVDYVLQALQGLAQAHALGIVHRDLKPANLFLAHQPDGTSIIKILDFGIARLGKSPRLTMQGAVGSPTYMSPEHIRNSEKLDHRTDIWAMGVVLYELLTGKPPIEGEGVTETLAAILDTTAPSTRTIRPEIPKELDAAIFKCLSHELKKRWADVAQLAYAIAPFGTGACATLPDAIAQTLKPHQARRSEHAIAIRSSKPDPSPTPEAAVVSEDAVPKPRTSCRWWPTLALVIIGGAAFGVLYPRALPGWISAGLPIGSDSAASSATASHARIATSASVHRATPSAHPSSSVKRAK
jgi:serine/threonine protein kinase